MWGIKLTIARVCIAITIAVALSLTVGCKSSKGNARQAGPADGTEAPKLAGTDDAVRASKKTPTSPGKAAPKATGRKAPPKKVASKKPPAKAIPSGPLIPAKMLSVQTRTCLVNVGSDHGMKKGAVYEILVDGKSIGRLSITTANTEAAGCKIFDITKRPIKGQAIELQLVKASN